MKATYYQRGEALDYKNDTGSTIEAGTVLTLGKRIGVAGTDIMPGEIGSVHVTGVYELEKSGNAEIAMGADVYFDDAGITATAGDVPAGYAAAHSGADDTKILVKLNA